MFEESIEIKDLSLDPNFVKREIEKTVNCLQEELQIIPTCTNDFADRITAELALASKIMELLELYRKG